MASVVMAERYAQGYTWDAYMEVIKVNKEHFLLNYEEVELKDEDRECFLSQEGTKGGPIKLLALAEDWCPDVHGRIREEIAGLNLSEEEARAERTRRTLQANRDFMRQETIRELRELLS